MLKRTVRKAHLRTTKRGKIVSVRQTYIDLILGKKPQKKKRSYQCPDCGALVTTSQMPNRGWVTFEAAQGLAKIKHPCMHRGVGLPTGRDIDTLELFPETLPN